MTPAVLWVLLVFVYLPTPHWGVASIEFPYSDTSGGRAPMVSTFASRNECLAGRKDVKEQLTGMAGTQHQTPAPSSASTIASLRREWGIAASYLAARTEVRPLSS